MAIDELRIENIPSHTVGQKESPKTTARVVPDKFSLSYSENIQKSLRNNVKKDKAILMRFGIISRPAS
jgi:hypothetical protein|tara:strand:+ start:366 stop:569 length:204 start_codon:yes stop_codon:yes gene_type:complete